jgi:hypothetical protein
MPGDPRERRELDPGTLRSGWRRVAGLILLDHSPAMGLAERMHGADVLLTVIGSFSSAGQPELLRRYYPVAARLARLPCWRLALAADASVRLRDAAERLVAINDRAG